MAVGVKALKAFKSGGSPPMPQPPAQAAPAAPAHGKAPAAPHAAAGAPDPGNEDTAAVAKALAEVRAGQLDPEAEQLRPNGDGDEDDAPPAAASDVELWGHCVEIVDPNGEAATKYPDVDPWDLVAQLYLNLGGEVGAGSEGAPAMPDAGGDDAGG